MKEQDFLDSLTYLGLAYGKEFTEIETMQYYDFLKEYTDETFTQAVKNIIRKSKFLPKINELIDECEKVKETVKFDILELMQQNGYFKNAREYEKASLWLQRNIIPYWFREDMKKYYAMMNQNKLENKSSQERLMIGG